MESIWKKTAELPEFHTLTKDIRTKVPVSYTHLTLPTTSRV